MKKGVNWLGNQVENWYKMLKNCILMKKIRSKLGPRIFGIKWYRNKLIVSAERGGQSDRDEA